MAYENLDDLKRENARLKAEVEVDKANLERDEERARVKKENFALRHRNKLAVVKRIGSGFGVMFNGIRSVATDIDRSRGKSNKSASRGSVRRVKRVRKSGYGNIRPNFNIPSFRF